MVLPKCNAILTSLVGLVLFVSALPLVVDYVRKRGPSGKKPCSTRLPRIEVVEGSFKRNSTLVATLVDFDIPSELAENVARLIQPVFDVRGFRSGQTFKLEKDTDGNLRAFEYKISDEKVLEVQRGAGYYEARVPRWIWKAGTQSSRARSAQHETAFMLPWRTTNRVRCNSPKKWPRFLRGTWTSIRTCSLRQDSHRCSGLLL